MIEIVFVNSKQHVQRSFTSGSLLIGGAQTEPPKDADFDLENSPEILHIDDSYVSSPQCLVRFEPERPDEIQLTNFGHSIALHSGPRIHRGREVKLKLPLFLCAGNTQVQFLNPALEHELDETLTTLESGFAPSLAGEQGTATSPAPQTLASWFDALDGLQKSVAGSREFFEQAARSIYNPGGLDGGMILKKSDASDSEWKVVASYIPYPEYGFQFRNDIVNNVAASGRAVFHDAGQMDQRMFSKDLHSCIACPVFDQQNNVVAVVYGFRSQHRTNNRRGIRKLEAQFIQLVAGAISAATIRMQSEADAARTRVLLEQAFAPKVARLLESNQDILAGGDRTVSVLFADLRGYSTIAERIGTRDTYRLLTDLMDRLSRVITDHDGVIIDFYGDGLSAFWNAPIEQPAHAHLACQAALDIVSTLPELNEMWATRLNQDLRVGVGVHTGVARVGNSGSSTRLKYGPRGNTVNIASRLENSCKLTGLPIVVSGETAAIVGSQFSLRRVCNSSLKGIRTPTAIFELRPPGVDLKTYEHWKRYDEALMAYESGASSDAIGILTQLQLESDDPVVTFLLEQALMLRNSVEPTEVHNRPSGEPGTLFAVSHSFDSQTDRGSDTGSRAKPTVSRQRTK
ncbi:MAG: adenylate/guanylate cyclase domain-containing protein [Planctomycetota bacterium]